MGKVYLEAATTLDHDWRTLPFLLNELHPKGFDAMQERNNKAKFKVLYRGVIARVLMEAAPSLQFSIAFFAMCYDILSVQSRAITMLSIAFSSATCFTKATKCLRIKVWHSK